MVRFKHRYVLCEVAAADARCRLALEERALGQQVRDAVARLHGAFGAAACAVGFAVRYVNAYTGVVLLRCRRDFCALLCSALPFARLDARGPGPRPRPHPHPHPHAFLRTLHVGGTIRTCQKFLVRYNRRQLLVLLRGCADDGQREAIRKSVSRSCLLQDSADEELSSDSGDEDEEEAAEAME
ncbi:ribonuclease P/MRP protein subunit POP5 [Suncus etruscus]|uniref:ribonuclease P/MRP protein subunit POP5 n=1 Tax=Suncus etruscus TaxID=109475 RepID=UPI00210FAB8F|nr:ribonuclease P/MRP protein subunit POP5 [Suncus etruscus]